MNERMNNLVYANSRVFLSLFNLQKCALNFSFALLDSLRVLLAMEPYDEHNNQVKLNTSDDWLRRRQGLALPVLPPTTPEARRFFFAEIVKYAVAAGHEGKKNIDYVKFS